MSNEFSDHRDDLCRRFRESLGRPLSERYYEEDELIDLFDYAGDLNDDYLRLEVLMSGARLYPDSEPLRLRRAIFYGSLENDAEAKFFQDNEGSGTLWDILSTRYSEAAALNPDRALERLLSDNAEFDDEEMIQFIQLAVSFKRYDWLFENIQAIKSHTDYPMTMYYELAVVSEDCGNYANAVRMLERLTEDDPGNAEQWYMLARDYEKLERYDEALNAVEFALALQPVSRQMRVFRADLLYRLDRELPNALADVEKLAKETPDDGEVIELLCNLNDQVNGADDTNAKLSRAVKKLDASYPVLTMFLLRINMDNPDMALKAVDLLHAFYFCNEREGTNSRANWEAWARFCVETGHVRLAFTILDVYRIDSGDPMTDSPLYLDLAVTLHEDKTAIEQVDAMLKQDAAFYRRSMHYTVLYLTALLRNGRIDEAAEAVNQLHDAGLEQAAEMTIDGLIRRKFFVTLIKALHQHLAVPENRTADYWAEFDPFR